MAKQEAVVLYSSTVMVEKDLVPSLWGGNSCCGLGDREVQYSTVQYTGAILVQYILATEPQDPF